MCTRNIEWEQIIIEHIQWKEVHHVFLVEENAVLRWLFIVDNASCALDIRCIGKNSKAFVTCIFLSKDSEKATGKVFGHLEADASSAEIYLLSLLWDRAECHVDGGVNILPNTKWASGHLLEENVILGKKVKVKTLPMLDVRSSDVSASHGAKIDRLDEWKLFYMMAKGLDQRQAQKLIVQWYIQRAWESVSTEDDDTKEQMISAIMDYLGMD